ncbi:MAG: DNA/RNA nuclease SfsA [Dorea sp.]|jgi:A/G-specific adenine glycosylase|nr:DNA/RNA nuclease SfsA [Dorea sp.]
MYYDNIRKGIFKERPNRFIAYIDIDGVQEIVHVKNTGRCAELLRPGVTVYVQEADTQNRKTRWDLIAVEKGGRIVNIDSQIPNKLVKEWLEEGNLFQHITKLRPEYTYGNSRFDLYVEADSQKIFIEVKGVTLEEDGIVRFPDAPSERAVKHVEELILAVKEGYAAYVFLVVQMKDVRYFTPNMDTHPAFGEALERAQRAGVHILAYDCEVEKDSIRIMEQVPVVLQKDVEKRQEGIDNSCRQSELPSVWYNMVKPVIAWYQENKRELPWRKNPDAYRVWVSEIMLQQTRVEAVKPYYERFLKELPTVKELAEAQEDKLLKLWEGLGYYNRVRNMQKAAQQIMIDYHGHFPDTYEEIRLLKGIGSYTAGAISAFAYGIPKPAVDGNVLRVISRLTGSRGDIMKQSVRRQMEDALEKVIPENAAADFNQGLIELGAIVCVPNGEPKCGECPVSQLCEAKKQGVIAQLPVKSKNKARKIEKRTVFIFRDGKKLAIRKRPSKGLLAGLYEFPSETGHMSLEEAAAYSKKIGLMPVRIRELGEAKHIFSHIEWHMTGYEILVDELEKTNKKGFLFIRPKEIEKEYPLPSALGHYAGMALHE